MADTTPPQNTDNLLPWHLNNTLSPEEKAEVTAYIETGGKEAEAELQLLKKMAEQSRQESSTASPGEMGWKRLQQQIRTEERQNAPLQSKNSSPAWYRPALAAALAIIVVQGSWLLSNKDGADSTIYQPLSLSQAQTPLLQVKFSPAATAQQIGKALRAAKVNIVDGPSAASIYHLQTTPATLAATQSAAKELRTHSDIIIHITLE